MGGVAKYLLPVTLKGGGGGMLSIAFLKLRFDLSSDSDIKLQH